MDKPFPAAWTAILEEHFSLYPGLTADLQEELRRKILVFLEEKNFVGRQAHHRQQ